MKIKGTITQEMKRSESIVWVTIEPTLLIPAVAEHFSTSLSDDADNVQIINNLMCDHERFELFAAMPAMSVAIGDTVELLCEVREMFGDFLILPNYQCISVTHTRIYEEFFKKDFWNMMKDAAVR